VFLGSFLSALAMAGAVDLDILRNRNGRFRTSATPCPHVDMFQMYEKDYLKSEDFEDQCLLEIFNGLCGGRYMEMGALDGVRFSNTYAFHISELDWRGVNVEMIPENYERLVANRPYDMANIHAAVCDKPQMVHYVHADSSAVGGVWEFASEKHKKRWYGDMTLENTTPIKCDSLQNLLEDALMTDEHFFDFFSLDIEGAEMQALKGIDFSKTGFGVLVVERHSNKKDNIEIANFLAKKGYDQFQCSCSHARNIWYVNREFADIYGEDFAQRFDEEIVDC